MNILQKKSFQDIDYWKLGSNPFGKPKMHVHCFLVDGLLIDTGHPHIRKDLLTALQFESINQIIVTHHHEDHSGNIEAIKQLKNVEAYASPLCCELMRKPKIVEPPRYLTWGQPSKANLIPLPPKTIVETDQYSFETIDTPGHAIDQISLYEASRGWLFSGDLYVHDYVKLFMREEDMALQIDSIQQLLQLDFDTLLCNHQPILTNGKERLQTKLQFLQDLYGRIEAAHSKGLKEGEIMQELGWKEFRFAKWFSFGQLSRVNMVRSVLRRLSKGH